MISRRVHIHAPVFYWKKFRKHPCKMTGSTVRFALVASAGWSSLAARRAHNPKVTGSNPVPATNILKNQMLTGVWFFLWDRIIIV